MYSVERNSSFLKKVTEYSADLSTNSERVTSAMAIAIVLLLLTVQLTIELVATLYNFYWDSAYGLVPFLLILNITLPLFIYFLIQKYWMYLALGREKRSPHRLITLIEL